MEIIMKNRLLANSIYRNIVTLGQTTCLFLFFGGGEANMSGSIEPKSVSGGSLSKGDEGVCNICLDSVSKQISAS